MADLDNEATRIFQSSMASNSWHVYKFAFYRFSNFRVEYKLELIWPVTVDHLIKYISYLSLTGFSVSTINVDGASSYRTVPLASSWETQ